MPLDYSLLCMEKFRNFKNQIIRYHALDPVAWVRRETRNIDDGKLRRKYRVSKNNTILIRPEESKASYLIDKDSNVNNILVYS